MKRAGAGLGRVFRHCKEVRFYFQYNVKPLEGGKQGDDIIYNSIYIFKRGLWQQCEEWAEGRQGWKQGDWPRWGCNSRGEMAGLGQGRPSGGSY